ncbi:MAG: type II toxin-antitoxin system PemK/MazF family toxin [Bacilli bacterium]
MSKKKFYIFNNYIYWTNLGHHPYGHEQGLSRPCLVLRTTKESEVCTILPLTLERLNDNIPYHIDLSNGKSTVLVEQIRTIDKRRIYDKLYLNKQHATINEEDRIKINEQLRNLYTLKEIFKKEEKSIDK